MGRARGRRGARLFVENTLRRSVTVSPSGKWHLDGSPPAPEPTTDIAGQCLFWRTTGELAYSPGDEYSIYERPRLMGEDERTALGYGKLLLNQRQR